MTIAQAKKLQAKLRKVQGVCTLLVQPYTLKEYPWADKDHPSREPFVIAGHLRHESFYEPEKDGDGWHGFFSVSLEHQEIPVQWISAYVPGPAFTLLDPEGYPVAIFSSLDEATRRFVELWPPSAVHNMSQWPKVLDPQGRLIHIHPRSSMLPSTLNYPWTA